MASILEKLEPSKARDALMDLIKHLTPQPFESHPPVDIPELLREFQVRAKVKPDDTSPTATTRVLGLATQELTARLLGPEAEQKARHRLGNRGELPLDSYDIGFGKALEFAEQRGIRKSHVLEAVRHPDK